MIPVFNWDAGKLVAALVKEVVDHGLRDEVDIHLYDDASDAGFLALHRAHVTHAQSAGVTMTLHAAPTRGGRSKARNALAAVATGRHLLFLDAHVLPGAADFLRRYLRIAGAAEVVCGGMNFRKCTDPHAPERFYLRYSQTANVAPPSVRMRDPWVWIYTANVMVSRQVFDSAPFDEGFVGYGYEDLEWGLRLSRNGRLLHIENPIIHFGLLLTKQALTRKTAEAARNLVYFWQRHPADAQSMALVRMSRRLAVLPVPMLSAFAWAARALFVRVGGPYKLEYALYQGDKVLRSALAFREASGHRRDAA